METRSEPNKEHLHTIPQGTQKSQHEQKNIDAHMYKKQLHKLTQNKANEGGKPYQYLL